MNWSDAYRRYEAGVWATPLALLPSFLLSAIVGQPSCLEPLIELVIAHTPLSFAHFVLNILGPLARPLALVGAVALTMLLGGLLGVMSPPITAARSHTMSSSLRWLLVMMGVLGGGFWLAAAATTSMSAFAAIVAGCMFVPTLLWTRTWRLAKTKISGRRHVLHSLIGGPLVTGSLVLLSTYELWTNAAVRLFSLGNPVMRLFAFIAPGPRKPGFPVQGMEPEVTPMTSFYRNGKNTTDPLLAQDWALRVMGLVRNPLTLTYQQLLALPRTNLYATMRCVDNPVDGHLMSTAYWSGVRVADLLERAQPLPGATMLLFHAADQFDEPFALAELSYETALLAYAMNGETLTQVHGAPVRVLLPGWYGFRNVKWLQEIEVTSGPVDGYWEHNGWQARETHPVARIDVARLLEGNRILVAGVAFGGLRGLSRVQVRIDQGSWVEAELNIPALSSYTWVQWRVVLEVATPQFHVTARMIDAAGQPQEQQAHDPYPSGSSGWHTIAIMC